MNQNTLQVRKHLSVSDFYVDIGIWVTQENDLHFGTRGKLSNTKLSCSVSPKV
jgi:hypothetical protein